MPAPLKIVSPARRGRGYLGAFARSEDAVLAVGGTDGDHPTVLASANARRFHLRSKLEAGLRDVCWLDGAWFVVGEYGWCARSRDDGATWTEIATHTDGCLFAVAADGDGVWIAGDDGYVARVGIDADAAQERELGLGHRIVGFVRAADSWWLLGFDGSLARFDGDTAMVVDFTADEALNDLTETPRGTLIASGDGGLLARSTDGGDAWQVVASGVVEAIEAVACLADGTILAVGGGATVLRSMDDGASFERLAHELDGTLWSIFPFGDGALIGGDDGLVVHYGADDEVPWGERDDRFAVPRPLDAVFAPGPDGFIGDRLRAYVVAMNPAIATALAAPATAGADGDPGDPAGEPADEPGDEAPGDEATLAGDDAWQPSALRAVRALWTGDTSDFAALWGAPPPPSLVAFEAATRGANLYSTFHELRLDVALMASPPPEENLFEQLVLNDQLNYLGTGLPEAFAGAVCFGQLNNGDTYHYDVYDFTAILPVERTVLFWNHETHFFEYTFARSLDATVYLAALCKAADEAAISDEAAQAGYAALHGRVAPSWHFSMQERAPDFASLEAPASEVTRAMAARAQWIIDWLRDDGVTQLEDLPERFVANLNPVMTEAGLRARFDAMVRNASTAIYALWRAFLFDEPELEPYLERCRGHIARLPRDAARLVDELRAGRNVLGKIPDVQRRLAQLRALDFDPRRAAARAEETAARQAATAQRAAALRTELAELDGAALEAFAWAHVREVAVHADVLDRALAAADPRARAAIELLAAGDYGRHNQLYRDEERDACAVIAAHAAPVLQAVVLGIAIAPAASDEDAAPDDADDGRAVVALAASHAWQILGELASATHAQRDLSPATRGTVGVLDPRALPVLRAELTPEAIENGTSFEVRHILEILGATGDRAAVAPLLALLAPLPAEGEFETALKHDELIGQIAASLRQIGDPAAAPALLRFAASSSLRMREARGESAFAIAALAPAVGTVAVLDALRRHVGEINDADEATQALLAYGLIGRAQPTDQRAALDAALADAKILASSYLEVQLARAVARQLLVGGEHDVAALLHRAFTEPGWNEKTTRNRGRWALAIFDHAPVVDGDTVARVLQLRDRALDRLAAPILARLGHPATPPRTLTWFDVASLAPDALVALVDDPALGGRHHAARALAAHPGPATRAALERALDEVTARASTELSRELTTADEQLAREATRALRAWPDAESTLAVFARMLQHPNRNVKGPVLRQPPAHPSLIPAMRQVAAEKWGWQEKTARTWLKEHDR